MADFLERNLSAEELAIAEWLLANAATSAARAYLPQLAGARVTGKCNCGCPTVHLRVADDVTSAEPCANPVAEAFGTVDGKKVGVMLLQEGGLLTCLEVYDMSDIERPYGLPKFGSLEAARWTESPSSKLTTSKLGFLVKAKTGRVVTQEMVKELSEDDRY